MVAGTVASNTTQMWGSLGILAFTSRVFPSKGKQRIVRRYTESTGRPTLCPGPIKDRRFQPQIDLGKPCIQLNAPL